MKILGLIFLTGVSIFSQAPTAPIQIQSVINSQHERLQRKSNQEYRNIHLSRAKSKEKLAELKKQNAEMIAELNEKFSIPESYRNEYSVFLSQKNTGISRIFPDMKCNTGLTVSVGDLERCSKFPQVKGNGSRYSIKLNWIPDYYSSDRIQDLFAQAEMYFNEATIFFGNKQTQSMVSEIGDVDINEITAKSPIGKVLSKFKPSRTKTELEQQNKILEKGITANGYFYSNFAPVKNNSVYVFRSITFSPFQNVPYSKDFWHTDLLAVFKVVGKESDGSIIFIWKKLKEENSPYLKDK